MTLYVMLKILKTIQIFIKFGKLFLCHLRYMYKVNFTIIQNISIITLHYINTFISVTKKSYEK